MTKVYLYNTLNRKKEEFIPLKEGKVGMYSCGPTVYWYQHIGNLKAYIFSDVLKRVLLFNDYKVKHVVNVTDVGHLTSDADEGEDKVEKAAAREGKTAKEITHYYFNLFHKDLEKLNVLEPDVWCWATDHIKEQIELIETLEKKGYTYKTSDGIYFDTSKIPAEDYAKLGRFDISGLSAGKRIGIGEKKNKTDFALWKLSEEPGVRQQEWKSPWGIGFPGWHIECSAMSSKYLGKQFDIHTGGEEHISVHHTNEIAQSESAFGKKPWVRYWLHQRWLVNNSGEKMSKSKGGILTLEEIEKRGFDPMVYRYFVLLTSYRKPLYFSIEKLESSKQSYERLKNIIKEIEETHGEVNEPYLEEFRNSINDDLNIPGAIQILWKLLRDKDAHGKLATLAEMDKVLGLNLLKFEEFKIPTKIRELVEKREGARKHKEWKFADQLRDEIEKEGYIIKDRPEGPKIEKI